MQLPATAKFDFLQKIPAAAVTTTVTNSYVEIGFTTAAGMIAGFDNVTGSDEMQLHLSNYTTPTWNTSQTDDYSFKACASGASTSAYTDRLTMPGYYQGQLAWGSEPDAP
jgi:nucleoside-specific outer membrane channel protein Tsx